MATLFNFLASAYDQVKKIELAVWHKYQHWKKKMSIAACGWQMHFLSLKKLFFNEIKTD